MRVRHWAPLGLQLLAGIGLASCYHPVHAQQAPLGIEAVPLTQSEYLFDTAEQHKVRVVVVVHGLHHPFAVALLPSGDALVSERGAGLRLVHNAAGGTGQLDPTPIDGLPATPAFRWKSAMAPKKLSCRKWSRRDNRSCAIGYCSRAMWPG